MKARPAAIALVATLLATDPAGADEVIPDRVRWEPRHELSFGAADFVVTGAATAVIVGSTAVSPHGQPWRGGILFDEAVRDAIGISSVDGRYAARDASDVGVSLATTWPFLVDALITAWWYRGRPDVARQMTFVSAEAIAVAAGLQAAANHVANRERPYGRRCGSAIPENSIDCEPDTRYRSFFSGHSTLSFTSAGLLCTHHLGLGLLGPAGDLVTCIGGQTVAVLTGTFRIMADMHYATDVALGALVGTAAGIAIPLLHMQTGEKSSLRVAPVGQGLGVVGTF